MAKKCTTHVGYSTLSMQFQNTESLSLNPVCCELTSQFSTLAQLHHTSALLSTHSTITVPRATIYTSESSSMLQSPNCRSSHQVSNIVLQVFKGELVVLLCSLQLDWFTLSQRMYVLYDCHETLAWVIDGFPLEFDCVYLWTSVCGSIDALPINVPGF